jgi:hypothetical protein
MNSKFTYPLGRGIYRKKIETWVIKLVYESDQSSRELIIWKIFNFGDSD